MFVLKTLQERLSENRAPVAQHFLRTYSGKFPFIAKTGKVPAGWPRWGHAPSTQEFIFNPGQKTSVCVVAQAENLAVYFAKD